MTIICALTDSRVIGRDNAIPWRISSDFAHFKQTTMGGTLIMGRGTWDSMGRRPLKGRKTIVLSRSLGADDMPKGVRVCSSMKDAVKAAESDGGEVFFAGGKAVYEEALALADTMLLSFVKAEYEGDTYFPEWDAGSWELGREEDRGEWVLREFKRKSGSS